MEAELPKVDLKVVTTHFESDVLESIEDLAERQRVSKADIIRDLLRRGLKHYEAERAKLDQQVPA